MQVLAVIGEIGFDSLEDRGLMEQRDDWHLTEMLNNQTGRGDPFAAAVRATRMPMVITDPRQADNPIVFVNEAFQKLSGYNRDEIIGRNCRFLQGPETDQIEVARVRRAVEQGVAIDIDLLNYRKDGSAFWNALFLSPVRSNDGDIRFFFASQLDVTERVLTQQSLAKQKTLVDHEVSRRTAELEAALEAKTLLLHEVDHRVKNNLNMIGSLLRLEARGLSEPILAAKLNTMLARLEALSGVHRGIYQGYDVTRFDVSAFLGTLVRDLLGTCGRSDIGLKLEISQVFIEASKASSLGLILNEVLTNAIKHGFADGRSGVLRVFASSDGTIGRVTICDDGPGFNTIGMARSGLGYTLMTRLAKQAGINVAFKKGMPGTTVTISFPAET